MQDAVNTFDMPLTDLADRDAWLDKVGELTEEDGYTERLGAHHAAILVEQKPAVLLVTFETHKGIAAISEDNQPMGWDLVKALGWSHLCLVSDGDTWFRDRAVYGFFDRLADDGFFEDFEQVIFYGAGPCGYAAAAFSVAAPGARVVAIQPQATLDPRIAEWDDRFRAMRRTAFDDRYGYAPDMLDAAERAFVLYDPEIAEDAMHAALFTRANVTKFRMRFMAANLDRSLIRMQLLYRILAQVSAGKLDRLALARLYRARRSDGGYQFNLLNRLNGGGRHFLTILLARHVLNLRRGRPFRLAMGEAIEALTEAGKPLPRGIEADTDPGAVGAETRPHAEPDRI
ncbi:phosphoadenosine phosphosulfate reductase [Roseovarius spongiae]|uniref:phosphoadenosine phosphosulfate reductase n=1 Tax=Roseovarius spongiae TaxID=2320272 RepID=UPI001980D877|nr:phosphoadenosine phosphosulfate reductase [Roseovarius spongiae]